MHKLLEKQKAKFNAEVERLEKDGYTHNGSYQPCPWNDDHELELWSVPGVEPCAEVCSTCGGAERR